MFPCPSECLNIKKFEYEDIKYQILLRKELKYCNVHREKIEKLANEVYMLGKMKIQGIDLIYAILKC